MGGRGTRLGALSKDLPKPLQPIAMGRSFLDYVLEWLATYRVSEVVMLSGHLGEIVAARYEGGEVAGQRIRIVQEDTPLGTGGALKNAKEVLAERFLLLNGDSLFDFDLAQFVAQANPTNLATLALRQVDDAERYGTVTLEDGQLTRFEEKTGRAEPGLINGGVYLMDRSVIDALPEGASSLERDLFPRLAAANQLGGVLREGYFIDIGLPETLASARLEMAQRGWKQP